MITVMGHDTVGVVAKVSTLCSELNINIEDVTQSILQGMFAMIMLVDISKCSVNHEELHQRMDALAKEMGDADQPHPPGSLRRHAHDLRGDDQ